MKKPRRYLPTYLPSHHLGAPLQNERGGAAYIPELNHRELRPRAHRRRRDSRWAGLRASQYCVSSKSTALSLSLSRSRPAEMTLTLTRPCPGRRLLRGRASTAVQGAQIQKASACARLVRFKTSNYLKEYFTLGAVQCSAVHLQCRKTEKTKLE